MSGHQFLCHIKSGIEKYRAQNCLAAIGKHRIGYFLAVLNTAIGFQMGAQIPKLGNLGAAFTTDQLTEAAR